MTGRERLEEHARQWRVTIEDIAETTSSLVAFGRRKDQPVVLKIIKQPGDEWRSGATLDAFRGHGAAAVYEYADGAALLERLIPGDSLADRFAGVGDDEATKILATVMGRMSPRSPAPDVPTANDWANSFLTYAAAGDAQIPRQLAQDGHRLYTELCASQTHVRLLHGDLHHHNVVFDRHRGWLAIDPKGVVAEREYETGAALRNPIGRSALFADPAIVETRVSRFASVLGLNARRILAWGFAQAVLSAIWSIEDGFPVDATTPSIMLAEAIRPMLSGVG